MKKIWLVKVTLYSHWDRGVGFVAPPYGMDRTHLQQMLSVVQSSKHLTHWLQTLKINLEY